MRRALEDIRILDLTHFYNGPYCTMLLGYLGAEIIKVEPPEGEGSRYMHRVNDDSYINVLLNNNKKGITLNLKSPAGREIFMDLLKKCDVVIENFSTGTMERLGLTYEAMSGINPRIIYAVGSGYGRSGPYKDLLAYDPQIQAMSGVMSLTGYPDQPPTKAGPPFTDFSGGAHLAVGILAALHYRDLSGRGQVVEVSIHDTIFSQMTTHLSWYYFTGKHPGRTGNSPPTGGPSGTYQAKDGWVLITTATPKQRHAFFKTIGHPEFIGDPRWDFQDAAPERTTAVRAAGQEWVKDRTRDEIVETLRQARVPSAKVLDLPEVLDDPHLAERKTVLAVDHPRMGRVKIPGSSVKLSETPAELQCLSPAVGQHNEEVYGTLLGYTSEDLARLRGEGII